MKLPDKMIFLDIDGVLNSRTFYTARQAMTDANFNLNDDRIQNFEMKELDITQLALLCQLVKETGAGICITSTWRTGKDPLWFRLWFYRRGIEFPRDCILWKTGHLPDARNEAGHHITRGTEIEQWMKDEKFTGKYVILDDDSDFLEHQNPYFVQTTHMNGFMWEHYDRALTLLGKINKGDRD